MQARRGGGESVDLCRAPMAKRGVGRRPLRKALEVIEARCSDDISSPPRCRGPTATLSSEPRRRNTIVTIPNRESEERLRGSALPLCGCVINMCARARARLHRVRSIGSPVAPGEALLTELRDFANLTIAKSIADIRYWRLKWNQFRIRCGVPALLGYRLREAVRLTEISKIEKGS